MSVTTHTPTTEPEATKWRLARVGLAAGLLVVAGALVTACGGGGDPSASGGTAGQSASNPSSANQSAIAFAGCMRANGVPNFPDSAISDTNGRVELNIPPGLDRNSSQFRSAMQTCRKDLPHGGSSGNGSSSSDTQQVIRFANCMRTSGVPNFPEPNSQGQELITGGNSGINPNSPQFQSAMQTCQHLLPSGAVGG